MKSRHKFRSKSPNKIKDLYNYLSGYSRKTTSKVNKSNDIEYAHLKISHIPMNQKKK